MSFTVDACSEINGYFQNLIYFFRFLNNIHCKYDRIFLPMILALNYKARLDNMFTVHYMYGYPFPHT